MKVDPEVSFIAHLGGLHEISVDEACIRDRGPVTMVKMKAVKKISWLRLGVLPVIFMLRTCWATTVIEMIFSTRNRYLCQKIIENMPKQFRIIISIYYTRTVSLLIKPV